jgi:hypothetical protein
METSYPASPAGYKKKSPRASGSSASYSAADAMKFLPGNYARDERGAAWRDQSRG